MKRLGCATILFILAATALAKALLDNSPLTTAWAMFGFWIMCLFIGCVAVEKALKEMGLK